MKIRARIGPVAKKLLFFVPVVLGVVVYWLMNRVDSEPRRDPPTEVGRPLRFITADPVDVVPRALAYGTARPGRVWRAVARVGGNVVETHRRLRNGGRLEEDAVVVRIDDSSYRNEIARLEAQLAQVRAQVAELDLQLRSDEVALKIEEQSLGLVRKQLERTKNLAARGAGSEERVDEDQRAVLTQEQSVQSLKSRISVAPAKRASLEANERATAAQLANAQLDLGYTSIRVPFQCVVPQVTIQKGQYVAAGEELFEANGTDRVELDAQISLANALPLMTPELRSLIEQDKTSRVPRERWDAVFDIKVRQYSGTYRFEWDGTISGTSETTDAETRTFGLVVAVQRPYDDAIPGVRPPLLDGTYCEVEVRSGPLTGRIVVPRQVVDADAVYVIGPDDRLERRPVSVAFSVAGYSVIATGIDAGDRVVVSDPSPAIVGMLVTPVEDSETARHLSAEARAEVDIR